MAGWGSVFTAAIATAAIMAIFPKIASMFAQAFAPITEAARVFMKNSGDREWYIAVNDAVGYRFVPALKKFTNHRSVFLHATWLVQTLVH